MAYSFYSVSYTELLKVPFAMNVKNRNAILCLVLLLGASGCAEFKMPTTLFGEDSLPEPVAPQRLSAVWKAATFSQRGKPGVRGFGGRLMFYAPNEKESVVVDGTLTVYAFDDENIDTKNAKPKKRFVYLSEQLASRYSESKLGHSYSVWIPWDQVGGEQRKISLVVRFESRQGAMIMSDASRQLLPGRPKEKQPERFVSSEQNREAQSIQRTRADAGGAATGIVQAGGFQREQSSSTRRVPSIQQMDYGVKQPEIPIKEHMTTVTIDVPARFVRRGAAASFTAEPLDEQDIEQTIPQRAMPSDNRDTVPPTRSPSQINSVTGTQSSAAEKEAESSTRYSRPDRYVRKRFRDRNRRVFQPVSDPTERQPPPAAWPSEISGSRR